MAKPTQRLFGGTFDKFKTFIMELFSVERSTAMIREICRAITTMNTSPMSLELAASTGVNVTHLELAASTGI